MQAQQRDEVILAALLHDVGKFRQRAGISLNYDPAGSEAHNFLPKDLKSGRPTHLHALHTLEFFEHFKPGSNEPAAVSAVSWEHATILACKHHSPDTSPEHILREADCLSSGMDREKALPDEEASPKGRDYYRRARLRSIFGEIDLGRGKPAAKYHLIGRLDRDQSAFPLAATEADDQTPKEYAETWRQFEADFASLKHLSSMREYLAALDTLLLHYTWAIPSSTMDQPNIPLYDHARTTAAIAAALYDYWKASGQESLPNRQAEAYRLIGGDISGIQDFIFRLSQSQMRGAAKILRARSFYLSALTMAAIERVCQAAHLSPFSVLVDAGGRFTMLAPNLPEVSTAIETVRQEINEWLAREFYGLLRLHLTDRVTLSGQDFLGGAMRNKIEQLGDALESEKQRPFSTRLQTDGHWLPERGLLDDAALYGDAVCEISGFGRATENLDDGTRISALTKNEIKMGQQLARAKVLWVGDQKPNNTETFFAFFGGSIHVAVYPDESRAPKHGLAYSINEMVPGRPCRYLANHIPRLTNDDLERLKVTNGSEEEEKDEPDSAGEAMTFSQIAMQGRANGLGVQMLGLLKADVDNLGLLVSQGLLEGSPLSRYVSFARMLNFFFAGHLGHLLESDPSGKGLRYTYTIFAGGDDLFLVTPWNTAVHLARHLREAFTRFTCDNANITLSAAVTLSKPRQPIRHGAVMAEEDLETAKAAKGKNAIQLFQTRCAWSEMEPLLGFGEWLLSRLREDRPRIHAAFVYRLLRYHQDYLDFVPGGRLRAGLYRAHLRYDIGRNILGKNPTEDRKQMATYLLEQLNDNGLGESLIMKKMRVPAFWTLYHNRGGRGE